MNQYRPSPTTGEEKARRLAYYINRFDLLNCISASASGPGRLGGSSASACCSLCLSKTRTDARLAGRRLLQSGGPLILDSVIPVLIFLVRLIFLLSWRKRIYLFSFIIFLVVLILILSSMILLLEMPEEVFS